MKPCGNYCGPYTSIVQAPILDPHNSPYSNWYRPLQYRESSCTEALPAVARGEAARAPRGPCRVSMIIICNNIYVYIYIYIVYIMRSIIQKDKIG